MSTSPVSESTWLRNDPPRSASHLRNTEPGLHRRDAYQLSGPRMTDLIPFAVILLYSIVMGRALLWQFVKLEEMDLLYGSVVWVAAVAWGWLLAVLLGLEVGLLW